MRICCHTRRKEGLALPLPMHVAASIPNFLAHEVPSLQAVKGGPTYVQRSPIGKSYIKKPFVAGGHSSAPAPAYHRSPSLHLQEREHEYALSTHPSSSEKHPSVSEVPSP
jgi:hypothetical protein